MNEYHDTRLIYDKRREILWKTLCEVYFQKLISEKDCVMELGAGYGHFINNIKCKRRIAVDIWDGLKKYVNPGIECHIGDVKELAFIEDKSIDFIFASNLFEHLSQSDFALILEQLRLKLSDHGTLNILQPNFRYSYREYFDDYTHISIYSDKSIVDFLSANGFKIIDCKPKFLPLTIKSSLPVIPALIRLYLKIPFKPLGKQMFIRAKLDNC